MMRLGDRVSCMDEAENVVRSGTVVSISQDGKTALVDRAPSGLRTTRRFMTVRTVDAIVLNYQES